MKAKTSLTLSEDLISALDRMAGPKVSRSSFVEHILREYVERRAKARRRAREVATINRHASALNAEMSDALSFQVSATEE
jgi:metal-responsive CopG/Arc/MetJ family transcriptional regulator